MIRYIAPQICIMKEVDTLQHLPWERLAGSTGNLNKALTGKENEGADPAVTGPLRQQVPWLAVLVFDPEELKLTPEELANLPAQRSRAPFPASLSAEQKTTPTSGAYSMTVAQFLTCFATPHRPNYEKMKDFGASTKEYARLLKSQESTNIIFPRRGLVTEIFGLEGSNIEQHKHLAHVRRVNTTGMPDVGVDEEGTFSVVVSHRTGELLLTLPETPKGQTQWHVAAPMRRMSSGIAARHDSSIRREYLTFRRPERFEDPETSSGPFGVYRASRHNTFGPVIRFCGSQRVQICHG
jgi:hypothetical protein